jgi:uncharacterized protein with ParB-like and HNH nuclease domain
MAYQTPITIKEAIGKIQRRKFVLPSIQREFVWDSEQIERLFDSIMRDYPISTFLLWNVQRDRIQDFQFYEFLQHYHERDRRHNNKIDLPTDDDVIAILDGQQRLTSIYIALRGSYAEKRPYFQWSSEHAFPQKFLYLNLLSRSEDIDLLYDFKFLTPDEAVNTYGYWFKVSEVVDWNQPMDYMQYLLQNGLTDTSKYTTEQSAFALQTVSDLYNCIHQKGTISYYLENSSELDKVLQIFIRINSGGTKLSYSDLLLSIATAQWTEIDARETIHSFVDEINHIGSGFDFNKDFVLKSCLVLGDFNDIKFKVDNFSRSNMLHIEQNWTSISSALRNAVRLIARFGFNRENLTTSNAIIPIAYYILKNNLDENYLNSSTYATDRSLVREWLHRVILKKTFGGTPDNLYPVLRRIINDNIGEFPLNQIIEHYRGQVKSIIFTSDDIENMLQIQYGSPLSFSALSMLYEGLNLSFNYHQDHIFPKKNFTARKLTSLGIDRGSHDFYLDNFNCIANLQLIEGLINTEKNAKQLDEWLSENYPDLMQRINYYNLHFFPVNASATFDHFTDFITNRKQIIRERLQRLLNPELAPTL